jgi:hypothetical protein
MFVATSNAHPPSLHKINRFVALPKMDLLMKIFDDTDAPYLEWVEQHPDGYVLNRRCGSSSG